MAAVRGHASAWPVSFQAGFSHPRTAATPAREKAGSSSTIERSCTMIKIVPDPPPAADETSPAGTLHKTAETLFGSCDAGHAPLFSIRAGINAEDALIHASLYLKCVCDTANAACNSDDDVRQGLLWSTLHSAEIAKALIDALLDGAEAQALSKAGNSVT